MIVGDVVGGVDDPSFIGVYFAAPGSDGDANSHGVMGARKDNIANLLIFMKSMHFLEVFAEGCRDGDDRQASFLEEGFILLAGFDEGAVE